MASTSEALREIAGQLSQSLPEVTAAEILRGELTCAVRADGIVKVLTSLRDDARFQFTQLIDICGADYPEREHRFDVVYHMLSMKKNLRIRLKVQVGGDDATVPTACGVFPTANWFEREVWDMYGVFFSDHPDLRRILTDYGFEGHPMRKDFPLFDFVSLWEGMTNVMPAGDEKAEAPTGGNQPGSNK